MEVNNAIILVRINRPESLNALDSGAITELNGCFRKLDSDQEVKVVIITGEGKSSVAGADIAEMSSLNATEGNSFAKRGTDTFLLVEKLSKPVITVISGFAFGGGCELPLACGTRIVSKKALTGQSEVGLGIIPGLGGIQRLAWTIEPGKVKELILKANNIKTDETLETDLVNKVAEPEELMNEAMKMAKKIASESQLAARYAKQAINGGLQTDIDTGMGIRGANFALCFATEGQKEGMKVFLEKRKPDFKGC